MSDAAQSATPTSQRTADAPDNRSRAHRLLGVLGAIVVAVVLPALLAEALVGTLGVWALLNGLLLGVAGSKIGGTHRMLLIAPAMGVVAGLGGSPTCWGWLAHCRAFGAARFVAN
jgi:hypothetical protein